MRKLPGFVVALTVVLALPSTALAQTTSVTLEASHGTITIGERVTLSGTVAPGTTGQTVEIVDASGAVVATATIDDGGAFAAEIEPTGTQTYRAVADGVSSPEVTVRVRATISARMSKARLFDEVIVRGVVRPARPGRRVDVALMTGGRVVEERRVEMHANGAYAATFRVMAPGTYRARAIFSGHDLVRARAVTDGSSTPLPRLSTGSNGVFVSLLEARLVELAYRLERENDDRYDFRTADAVIAFHKVNRMSRTGIVDAATWRALADPVVIRAEHDWRGLHLEVDQTRQVALVVEDGAVTAIFHVSTGKASTPTRDGIFRVHRKIAGYSPNRLYYPSYFDGNRAFHGWPEVPTYPASHGCVRVPYWNALWVYGLADYGTRVAVYH